MHGGASGPDVVEEKVSGVRVDLGFWADRVGFGGLREPGFGAGANLDGVVGADENIRDVEIRVTPSKVLGDEFGMVEATGANMFANGGERDDIDRTLQWRENLVENVC